MTYHAGAAMAGIDFSNSQNPNVMLLGDLITRLSEVSPIPQLREDPRRAGRRVDPGSAPSETSAGPVRVRPGVQ